jgi:hypothetical protein
VKLFLKNKNILFLPKTFVKFRCTLYSIKYGNMMTLYMVLILEEERSRYRHREERRRVETDRDVEIDKHSEERRQGKE